MSSSNKPLSTATRGTSPRVALVTCAELPDLDPDDRLVTGPLAARGITAVPAVWDDGDVDWDGFDLVVLRSPWDYAARRDEFVAWAQTVARLANPAKVVLDNTDKRYLAGLAAAGVPVVATRWLEPGESWPPAGGPAEGEYVVKPAVSAGSHETGRYDLSDPRQRRLAGGHVERLHAAGKIIMIQPYLSAVDHDGETALVFIDGRYSHAIRKGPLLDGPYEALTGLYRPEQIEPRVPSGAERDAAARVLAAAPGDLLYARVDLIPGPDGAPLLVELELTEPSLFLAHAPGAAERFADAIAARL
jgi:glutathione synthase/RimK-type ligase-like ATP-grasp enzyme